MVLVKVFNKIVKLIFITLNLLWTLPIFFIFILLSPIVKVKIGKIRSDRIGHFGLEIGILAGRIKDERNTFFLFCIDDYVSNRFLVKIAKKQLIINGFVKFLYLTLIRCPFLNNFKITWSLNRDIKGYLYKNPFEIFFSSKEQVYSKNWLKKHGWSEGQKFYCVLVRDDAYLKNNNLYNKYQKTIKDFSYHSYRDSNIDDYKIGIEWLANKKIWVIRMGRKVNKPINSNHPYVIDYPFNDIMSDELDVWLLANCEALISTGTGIESVSQLALKPILFLNAMPLKNINSFYECIWAPKNLFWKQNHLPLTLKEYFDNTYFKTSEYENNKILIEDLSKEDILECIKEFFYFVSNNSVKNKAHQNKQKLFWNILGTSSNYSQLHEWIHPKCKVSTTWLNKQNSKFFLD